MNLSRAKRRWKAWDRYCDRSIAITGGVDRCPPGAWDAYNERAMWRNTGNWGRRVARRFNRRRGGWRR